MSELISGKEAFDAAYNGHEAQWRWTEKEVEWRELKGETAFSINELKGGACEFRLKPRAIKINNIEVPAPFKPKGDCTVFIIDDGKTCNYRQYDYEFGAEDESNWIGIWRTKSDIEQVVAALRSIFSNK